MDWYLLTGLLVLLGPWIVVGVYAAVKYGLDVPPTASRAVHLPARVASPLDAEVAAIEYVGTSHAAA